VGGRLGQLAESQEKEVFFIQGFLNPFSKEFEFLF
jgi:hypothetical protein